MYSFTKIYNVKFPIFEMTCLLMDYSGTHFYEEPIKECNMRSIWKGAISFGRKWIIFCSVPIRKNGFCNGQRTNRNAACISRKRIVEA